MANFSGRFLSLDVFRGGTVAFMILVNNQYVGSAFGQLRHSGWDGCTVTDLVFPFFLFIVGASFFFVAEKRGFTADKMVYRKIVSRSLSLFGLGLFLNWYWSDSLFDELRIMGVLQRIALVYLIGALLLTRLKTRTNVIKANIVVLLFYWVAMNLGSDYSLEGNLVRKIDLLLLGEAHLYGGYGVPFDPEGVFSTIGALCSMFFGYTSAALLLRQDMELIVRVKNLFWAGFGCWILSMMLEFLFPINKPLWSSTYVLLSSGWAMMIWSMIVLVVDIDGHRRFTKGFVVFGTNAIFSYLLASLLVKPLYTLNFLGNPLSQWFADLVGAVVPEKIMTLLWGILVVLLVWGVTYPLYKRNFFVKL